MIAVRWNKWESENAKLEVRLAELRALNYRVSKTRYLNIVKADGLKSA